MKRPRNSYTQACYNCGRSGVLPGAMLQDDDGNRFCGTECGWSYLFAAPDEQARRRTTTRRPTLPPAPADNDARLRQDLAHADRVQHLLRRRMRRDPRYHAAMRSAAADRARRGVVLPHDAHTAPKHHRRPAPTRHAEHAMFAFAQLLGDMQ